MVVKLEHVHCLQYLLKAGAVEQVNSWGVRQTYKTRGLGVSNLVYTVAHLWRGKPPLPPNVRFFFFFFFFGGGGGGGQLPPSTLPPMQSIKGNAKIDQNWGMP